MLSRSQIKHQAKELLKKAFLPLLLLELLTTLAMVLVNFVPFIGTFLCFLITPFNLFLTLYIVKSVKDGEEPWNAFQKSFSNLSANFLCLNLGKDIILGIIGFALAIIPTTMISTSVMRMLFTGRGTGVFFLGLFLTLVVTVLLVIVQYRLYAFQYLTFEDAKLENFIEYFKESFNKTKGHALNIFVFHLTFVGWTILLGITSLAMLKMFGLFGIVLTAPLNWLYTVYFKTANYFYYKNVLAAEEVAYEL